MSIRVIYSILKDLTQQDALAGIILTHDSYDLVRDMFGTEAQPYNPGFIADPRMEQVFVVDGLLVMRGTKLQ